MTRHELDQDTTVQAIDPGRVTKAECEGLLHLRLVAPSERRDSVLDLVTRAKLEASSEGVAVSTEALEHDAQPVVVESLIVPEQQWRTRKTDLYIQNRDSPVRGCAYRHFRCCWLYHIRLL